MIIDNDIASAQPSGKFQGLFNEVREELELFQVEMRKHQALLEDAGMAESED